MNKNKKSKVVLFSVLGLAAISIGTVGFATWMVGVEKKSETLTFTANVDNTLNESIYLEAVASTNKIVIAESAAHTKVNNDILGAKIDSPVEEGNVTVSADALKFTFTTLKFSAGNDAEKPAKLHISLEDTSINTINKVETSKVDGRSTGPWTYLAFDKTFTIDYLAKLDSNDIDVISTAPEGASYTVYDFSTKTFVFDWGTFFDGNSPVTYYNLISNGGGYNNAQAMFTLADNVNAELEAMNTALKNGELKVKVALEA